LIEIFHLTLFLTFLRLQV